MICKKIRQEGKTIVTTNGCFDILHLGHVEYLQKASELSDILIVGINSQDSVRRIKGSDRPIMSEQGRVSVVAALGFVDYCVIFDEDTPIELLKTIKPDIHIKGGDYLPDGLIEKKVIEDNGGVIMILPLVAGYSTTSIIEKLQGR
ncbi:MAG: D-glycero-beta-D-manno-heptose 1-phosphate adenylyltransferase [Spirochaetes bacterium]|nr:D-glycero-beta-D-manno-heptose 1-phosphate adenylyltransferase [Spirochaetota bacterium]